MFYNRRTVSVITPPSSVDRAVSVSDMKAYLRVTSSDDDTLIGSLIDAATQMARNYCRRAILEETLELTLDQPGKEYIDEVRLGAGVHNIPRSYVQGSQEIDLPFPRVQSISSIKTYGTDNTESTYSSDNYSLDIEGGRIYLDQGATWPSNLRDRNSMVIRYVAGYDTVSDIPAPIIQAIKMHVAYMYECRQSCEMPDMCKALLQGYRLMDYLWCA